MHRRADDELTTILEGGTGGRRPHARDAQLVLGLRSAFRSATPPPPSAELASLLDLTYLDEASARLARTQPVAPAPPARTSHSRRRWVGWLTGLSLAWQVGVGSTAAFAAVGGAGVAGVLPAPAQDVFDRVVTTVAPLGRDGDEAGMYLPTEDRPAPAGRGVLEPTARTDDADALVGEDPEGRSRRDGRRRATEQSVPPGDDRSGAPGASGASGQDGARSEGPGARDRERVEEKREDTGEAEAEKAADEAEEAADEAEEVADEAEEAEEPEEPEDEAEAEEADGERDDR